MDNIPKSNDTRYEVKKTEKYGNGVFCIKKIHKSETVRIFTGERISELVCDKMIDDGLLSNDNPLQIQHEEYIILDDVSLSFNHSCEPNAGMKGESTLFAIRDIQPGEEITYDYSTTVDPHNFTFTTMNNCLCGSSKCRRILGNVLSIPKETLDFYKSEGALQDYIIKELNKI